MSRVGIGIGVSAILSGCISGGNYPQYTGKYVLTEASLRESGMPLFGSELNLRTLGYGSSSNPSANLELEVKIGGETQIYLEPLTTLFNCSALREGVDGSVQCVTPPIPLQSSLPRISLGSGCYTSFIGNLEVKLFPDPAEWLALYRRSSQNGQVGEPNGETIRQNQDLWLDSGKYRIEIKLSRDVSQGESGTNGCAEVSAGAGEYLQRAQQRARFTKTWTFQAQILDLSISPFSRVQATQRDMHSWGDLFQSML